MAKIRLYSNDYPQCLTRLYTYSDRCVYHQNTCAASHLSSKKHGHLLLTSYSVYDVVICAQMRVKQLLSRRGVGLYQKKFTDRLLRLQEFLDRKDMAINPKN